MRYEEGYDLYDKKYLQWLSIHHPNAIPIEPGTPDALFDFGTLDDLLAFAGDSTLEDCLMHLDRMFGMEDEDIGGGEDGNGDIDDHQSSFGVNLALSSRISADTIEFTHTTGSTLSRSTPESFLSPSSTRYLTSPLLALSDCPTQCGL